MIHHGDCLDVMAGMELESVDAIVTDPPYGLEFMGKEWDRLGATVEHPDDGEGPWGRTRRVRFRQDARSMQGWHQRWAEAAYRVAKPSAYLLAFGGTRTVHRMTCALEDAGWIVRDMLVWAYARWFDGSSDEGTYSRYFLVPKADRADREPALGGLSKPVDARGLTHGGPGEPGKGSKEGYEYHPKARANVHPTVKPTELMRHLVRLVTPSGGIVLDPFLGSGTTALAAEMEGFEWIGIEKEAEYVAIAEARLNGTQRGLGLPA